MVECIGHHASGIHTIRNRQDIDRLLLQIDQAEDVVIIGAGYIGLEAAAALTKYNKKITIVETQDRVLARVAGEPISRFFESEHRTHGVVIRLSETIDSFETDIGVVSGVRMSSGEIIPAQLLIVGIGIVPNIKPLEEAGAACSNGVFVDGLCRTNLADVFAIGDCAAHYNAFASGAEIRLESVQNANDQATLVAKQIAGKDCSSYDAVPWFWSNQYDIRLQTVGLSTGFDHLLIRGSPETRSFSVIYFRAGRPIALDCVNNIKDYVQGKALLNKQWDLTDEQWRDVCTPLKSIAQW